MTQDDKMNGIPFYRPGTMAHQLEAFERFRDASHFALFWEPRCRKSSVALNIFRYRYGLGPDDPRHVDALVVLSYPSGVKWVWAEEAQAEYPPEFLELLKVLVWESGRTAETKARRAEALALRAHPGPVILSMNCESILTDKGDRYVEWLMARRRVMLVADECFTGDTLVTTPFGDIPIEHLVPGDIVTTPSGYSVIEDVLRRESNKIVYQFANQAIILKSTCNHPLFTDLGWVCANDLCGRTLIDRESVMRLVRQCSDETRTEVLLAQLHNEVRSENLCSSQLSAERSAASSQLFGMRGQVQNICKEKQEILRSILQSEMAVERSIAPQKHISQSTPARTGWTNSIQDWSYSLEQGCAQTKCVQVPWWEWAYASGASGEFAECLGSTMDGGIRHSIGRKATWLSNLLQGRFGIFLAETGDRGGRSLAQKSQCTNEGCEKRFHFTGTRVDRVEVEQRPCPVPVFDLQLNGDPRYFANGFLAHNSWMMNWSKRTQRALAYSRRPSVVVRALLDGSPVDEAPTEVFFPSQFLRPGLLGYSTKAPFEARYCELAEGTRWNPRTRTRDTYPVLNGYRNLDELRDKLLVFGSRVRREDVSDAPPKTYGSGYFEMTPRQRRVYEGLRDEYAAELKDGRVMARDVLYRMTRLQMVTRNFWPPERRSEPCRICDGRSFDNGDDCFACGGLGVLVETSRLQRIDLDANPALDALLEVVAAVPQPFVVWCRFRQDVADAVAALRTAGHLVVEHHGGVPDAEAEANYQAFKAGGSGAPAGIVGTVSGGLGRGKNLSRATLSVFYSNDFSLRLRRQAEDRTEGVARYVSTTVVDLIAVGTRDADVVGALRAKRDLAALVMGDPRPWLEG